jgi:hypothetical protein
VREAIVEVVEAVEWVAEVDVVDTCLVVNKEGRPFFLANLLIFKLTFFVLV